MSMLQFKWGLYGNLPQVSEQTVGTVYVTKDEQAMYVDVSATERVRLGQIVVVDTITEWEGKKPPFAQDAFYYVKENNALLRNNGTADSPSWVQINSVQAVVDALDALKVRVAANEDAILGAKGEDGQRSGGLVSDVNGLKTSVGNLTTSVGSSSDAAAADGSVYARIAAVKATADAAADAIAAIPQADWNQNDSTAPDYIKNRTHYESVPEVVGVIYEGTIPGEDLILYESNNTYYIPYDKQPSLEDVWIEEGDWVEVILDGNTYYTQVFRDYYLAVGDKNFVDPPFTIYFNGLNMTFATPGDHDVKVSLLSGEAGIVQLDEKFIPDTIARVADVNNSLNTINNQIINLEQLVGEESTSKQIEDAIAGLNIGDYAKTEDVNTSVNKAKEDAIAAAKAYADGAAADIILINNEIGDVNSEDATTLWGAINAIESVNSSQATAIADNKSAIESNDKDIADLRADVNALMGEEGSTGSIAEQIATAVAAEAKLRGDQDKIHSDAIAALQQKDTELNSAIGNNTTAINGIKDGSQSTLKSIDGEIAAIKEEQLTQNTDIANLKTADTTLQGNIDKVDAKFADYATKSSVDTLTETVNGHTTSIADNATAAANAATAAGVADGKAVAAKAAADAAQKSADDAQDAADAANTAIGAVGTAGSIRDDISKHAGRIQALETASADYATKAYADQAEADAIATAKAHTDAEIKKAIQKNDAMYYAGTVKDGTLPASGMKNGATYKVETEGSYGGQYAYVGDLFIASGTEDETTGEISGTITWDYIPSGYSAEYVPLLTGEGNNTIALTSAAAAEGSGDLGLLAINGDGENGSVVVEHTVVSREGQGDQISVNISLCWGTF